VAAVLSAGLAVGADAALIATQVAPADIQGYWQFDESNSASPPLANPTPDQSGQGRDGTYQASASRLTDGSFSAALGAGNKVLNTTNVENYEVTVPEPSPVSLFGIGASFTVSLWVKADADRNDGVGTFVSIDSLTEQKGWRFGYVPSTMVLFLGQQGSTITYASTIGFSPQPFQRNQWQFMTYTYDAGTTTGTIYRNGAYVVSRNDMAQSQNPATPAYQKLAIGGQSEPNANEAFKGQIDEVAIWNATLSPAQVYRLYLLYTPEPASAGLLTLAGLALLLRRRR
jgi:hypothetical protein